MDAQELKQELGNRAKDIILQGLGLRENREKKISCPLHKEKTPSMSWYDKGFMWKCFGCGEQIDIYRYYTEFENMTFTEAMGKVTELLGKPVELFKKSKEKFLLPNIKVKELEQPFIDYMAIRKITKETLYYWKVKQHTWEIKDKKSGKVIKKSEVYVFQYFDDKGDLIYVSYRGLGKDGIKGGCEPKTKSILWGMWHIDKTKPLVITEGQPDAMAVWQSGYKNVVSVPGGSSNLKWIDHCWEWLQGIPEFIVFADNDSPGLEMANNIKRKLHNVKIITADRKDANEVLYFEGPEKIKELINQALNQMPLGLIDLSDLEYESAIKVQGETIETGFYEYDSHVEDWKMEELTVIFGRNGEGKTTFISQIISHCIEKGVKTFLYSGEMSDIKIQDWLYRQMIGNKKEYLRTIVTKYRDKVEPKPEVIKKIKEWHKGKLFLYDRSEQEITGNLDKFFEVMELAAKRYGVKLFVIDNLMAILEENADSLFSDQANFIQRCKNFVINNKVHCVLLAHPNKEKREIIEGQTGNLEKTDISGSNNIPNKADNIIAVERVWGDNRECDAIVTSLKDRETGQRKQMKFFFSTNTLRFYNGTTSESKVYGWEKIMSETAYKEQLIEGFRPTDERAPWD